MAAKFVTHLDLNKNELQNASIQNLAAAPSTPATGQIYFNTTDDTLYIYDGSAWVDLTGDIQSITAGTGLTGGGTDGDITINLADTAVTPGSYGSSTEIPTFTVDAQGRLTAASTASISTTLNIAADSGTDDGVALATDELTIAGGANINTSVSGDTITVNLDDDVTIGNDLVVTGDLTVNGTTTTVNSTTVTIDDPIFTLGGDSAPASDDDKDRGIEFKWHDGTSAKVGFFGYDDSTGRFTFITDATNTSEVFSGSLGDVDVNAYFLNGTEVLSGTTLGSTIVTSSLTSVGTIATGTWEATDVAVAHGGTGASTAGDARDNLAETSSSGLTTDTPTLARIAAQDCAASSGSTSATTVTHNFGTQDVVVQVFEASTNATVVADVDRTSTNAVIVTMNGASISAGDYRIVVTG